MWVVNFLSLFCLSFILFNCYLMFALWSFYWKLSKERKKAKNTTTTRCCIVFYGKHKEEVDIVGWSKILNFLRFWHKLVSLSMSADYQMSTNCWKVISISEEYFFILSLLYPYAILFQSSSPLSRWGQSPFI